MKFFSTRWFSSLAFFLLGALCLTIYQKVSTMSRPQFKGHFTVLKQHNEARDDDDSFDQMQSLHEKILKRFGGPNFFGQVTNTQGDIRRREDEHFVYYEISLDGLNQQKLKVKVGDGQINISGQTESNSGSDSGAGFQSFMSSSFQRSLPIPPDVDEKGVKIENVDHKMVIKFPKV